MIETIEGRSAWVIDPVEEKRAARRIKATKRRNLPAELIKRSTYDKLYRQRPAVRLRRALNQRRLRASYK